MTFPFPALASIPGPASGSLTANTVSNVSSSSYSFASQAIGAEDATRRIAIAVTWYNGNEVDSVTVGGVAATKVSDPGVLVAGESGVSWWVVDLPTGTTATVQVTFTAAVSRCGIGVFRIVGARSGRPVRTRLVTGASNPFSTTVDAPSGSVVLAGAVMTNTSAAGSYTWAGVTEQYDQLVGGATKQSAGLLNVSNPTMLAVSSTYTLAPNANGTFNVIVLR